MFEPQSQARVFGVPPGVDFPGAVADHLVHAYRNKPPEALADVLVFANAGRMARRLTAALCDGAPRLLPRITLVSDLAPLVSNASLPPAIRSLDRTLEMARLLEPLMRSPNAPAPRGAVFDLADSLIALLDEMHTEDVSVDDLLALNVEGAPRHWAQTKELIAIVGHYLSETRGTALDSGARQRMALHNLLKQWQVSPPTTPVLVVGSTGSRGTTFDLMRAVATLPQGAVVLPGFDASTPASVWERLMDNLEPQEDHPQYRFASFLSACGLTPGDVPAWPSHGPNGAQNALVSLSLRPAPVTDQWRTEGASLGDLAKATRNLRLILTPQPRAEANAIAVAMREAVVAGESVALVTPDRTLGRRVTAALQRWKIVPDDSAGMPLSLSPPGRFLRQVANMLGKPVAPGELVALLRHPLTRTGGEDRGQHSLWTDALEVTLRKIRQPDVSPEFVSKQGENGSQHEEWGRWVGDILKLFSVNDVAPVSVYATRTRELAERIARGGATDGSGTLWDKDAGQKSAAILAEMAAMPAEAHPVSLSDYRRLLNHLLASENILAVEESRSDVMILGTLEARAQSADLVILGGLNDGIWPTSVSADPWLSRKMRRDAGLLSPDRQIGLSAHDYQQAICAPKVILSRAKRDEEAETVPSRWLNRLTNLLEGLPDQGGPDALKAMTARGDVVIAKAASLDAPLTDTTPCPRPAPAPPASARPRKLSVTEIEKLIRDPYWVYAKHVLRLRPLDQLVAQPSPALRGQVFHRVVERFIARHREAVSPISVERFLEISQETLDEMVPWKATRRLWFGHLKAISEAFVASEKDRQRCALNAATEVKGSHEIPSSDFVITGEADRIDVTADGSLRILDYKSSSTVPTHKQAKLFSPQILIEAFMAEAGAFSGVPASKVIETAYVSLARSGNTTVVPMDEFVITHGESKGETLDFRTSTIATELEQLLEAYAQQNLGYTSRRAMEKVRYEGDYDHLARFGEWDDADQAMRITLS